MTAFERKADNMNNQNNAPTTPAADIPKDAATPAPQAPKTEEGHPQADQKTVNALAPKA